MLAIVAPEEKTRMTEDAIRSAEAKSVIPAQLVSLFLRHDWVIASRVSPDSRMCERCGRR